MLPSAVCEQRNAPNAELTVSSPSDSADDGHGVRTLQKRNSEFHHSLILFLQKFTELTVSLSSDSADDVCHLKHRIRILVTNKYDK